MSDSKSGSKDNLNESNMPLLSEEANEKAGDTPEKEVQEMELEEKKDDSTEKEKEGETEKKDKKEKKEKKKKEKKEKVKKEPKEKGPSCLEVHSAGLNLENRDLEALNEEVNIEFSSVFAEPTAAHGFDGVFKLNYVMFNQTKLWVYKILSALISLPLALLWAVVFSLLTVVYVWLVKPVLALFTVVMAITKKVLTTTVDSTIAPVARSVGLVFHPFYRQPAPQQLVQTP